MSKEKRSEVNYNFTLDFANLYPDNDFRKEVYGDEVYLICNRKRFNVEILRHVCILSHDWAYNVDKVIFDIYETFFYKILENKRLKNDLVKSLKLGAKQLLNVEFQQHGKYVDIIEDAAETMLFLVLNNEKEKECQKKKKKKKKSMD